MEKIAIISDIHGNITALDKVLEDIEKRGINRVLCLGDMIVKCSSPKECVEKVLANCEVVVKGNCEQRCVEEPKITEHIWNKNKLTDEQQEKIKNLPLSYDFYMSGYKIRMMHASPYSIHQKSYTWDLNEGFEERFNMMFDNTEYLGNIGQEEPDIVLFGHIHKPFLYRIKNRMIINPGAVSNTSDIVKIKDKYYTYGSYLIIEGEYGSKKLSEISYEIVKFTYDNEKEAERIINTDMPNKEFAYEEILTGKYFSRLKLRECGGIDLWKE